MIIIALILGLFTACATPTSPPLPTRPSDTCDYRMVDRNRRACIERGGVFITTEAPGSCGACTK